MRRERKKKLTAAEWKQLGGTPDFVRRKIRDKSDEERLEEIHEQDLTERHEDARKMLLEEYSRKPVRRLLQMDCFTDMWGDTATGCDEDGHTIMAVETHELKNLKDVRILIPEGADKEETMAALAKACRWLSEDWEVLMNLGEDRMPEDTGGGS